MPPWPCVAILTPTAAALTAPGQMLTMRAGLGSAERGAMLAECGASRATTSLPRGRFFLIVAGRFPAVKNNLNLIRTAYKAGGCCISPTGIAHTPGVERGNELAHAAHDLPRPSAATKASSKVVLRNGHFWAVLQPFRLIVQTQVPNQC